MAEIKFEMTVRWDDTVIHEEWAHLLACDILESGNLNHRDERLIELKRRTGRDPNVRIGLRRVV